MLKVREERNVNTMFSFGKTEDLVIILLIILLLFGAKKLPELSRSIGQSAREIRNGFNGSHDEKEAAQKHEVDG
jgi:sec-independent protein translocase protein TatA